jgi:GNAT superfamily N-acetyltransferase
MRLVTWAERPELADHGIPSGEVWPEYNLHGDVFAEYWGALEEEFPEFQFALLDGDVVVAEGHTAPLAWDGADATLPAGIDDALRAAVLARRAGDPVDTLCAMAAEVSPSARQRGVAAELLRGMRELAGRHGLRRFIAPVRPSWKERYPLTAIERYVTWRRADGQLLDPWMRLHERLGARVSTPLPESMRITGTVAEWESWTGLAFPEDGDYVFPHGLAPLRVEAGIGRYVEPNVWIIHPEPHGG